MVTSDQDAASSLVSEVLHFCATMQLGPIGRRVEIMLCNLVRQRGRKQKDMAGTELARFEQILET